MQATINKRQPFDVNPLITFLMLGLGILAFVVAGLIALGWLPLGERIDILRSNKNLIEYIAIVLSIIYGIACIRTFSGLSNREKAGIAWARWLSFITIFIGLALTLSVLIPTYIKLLSLSVPIEDGQTISREFLGTTITISVSQIFVAINISAWLFFAAILGVFYQLSLDNSLLRFLRDLPDALSFLHNPPQLPIRYSVILFLVGFLIATPAALLWVTEFPTSVPNIRTPESIRLLPGLLLFVLPLLAYLDVRHGEEESDELRRAISLPPHQFLQTQLATSPSAGAIIGFLAIFMAFTMATDLFLRPTSVASILTNVSSKGVIAIGVTILMISGEFDLSVGSILGVVAMTFMAAMTLGDPIFGIVMSPLPAALFAIFIGALLGFFNGFILVTTRIPSFIVTLGTMLLFRAFVLIGIAGGRILRYSDHHDALPEISLSPFVFILLAVVGLLILVYTAFRVLPVIWQRTSHYWSIRNNNGDFGTTQALGTGTFALVTTLLLSVVAIWLLLITLSNFSAITPYTVQIESATVHEIVVDTETNRLVDADSTDDSDIVTRTALAMQVGDQNVSEDDTQALVELENMHIVQQDNNLTVTSDEVASIAFNDARIIETLEPEDFRRIYALIDGNPDLNDENYEELSTQILAELQLIVLNDIHRPMVQDSNNVNIILGDNVALRLRNARIVELGNGLSRYQALYINSATMEDVDGILTVQIANKPLLVFEDSLVRNLASDLQVIEFVNSSVEADGSGVTVELNTSQRIGYFDIANGRWTFTGSDLTQGLIHIAIPRDANFRMAIVWWFILVLFFHVILTSTSYGNSVFAVGGNEGAARAQGINVNYVKVFNFVLVAVLTGIAAIYETARNPGVDPLKGDGWELQVIAMTVIGGALLSGGYGGIFGSMLGALIVGMVQTGLVLSGAPSRAFAGVVGAIIIIAVILNTSVRGRQGD